MFECQIGPPIVAKTRTCADFQMQDAYRDYMRRVGALLLRDANMTLDASEERSRLEQFVDDAYTMEANISHVLTYTYLSGF